jgi:hypothetical protein
VLTAQLLAHAHEDLAQAVAAATVAPVIMVLGMLHQPANFCAWKSLQKMARACPVRRFWFA